MPPPSSPFLVPFSSATQYQCSAPRVLFSLAHRRGLLLSSCGIMHTFRLCENNA